MQNKRVNFLKDYKRDGVVMFAAGESYDLREDSAEHFCRRGMAVLEELVAQLDESTAEDKGPKSLKGGKSKKVKADDAGNDHTGDGVSGNDIKSEGGASGHK